MSRLHVFFYWLCYYFGRFAHRMFLSFVSIEYCSLLSFYRLALPQCVGVFICWMDNECALGHDHRRKLCVYSKYCYGTMCKCKYFLNEQIFLCDVLCASSWLIPSGQVLFLRSLEQAEIEAQGTLSINFYLIKSRTTSRIWPTSDLKCNECASPTSLHSMTSNDNPTPRSGATYPAKLVGDEEVSPLI